MIRVTPGCSTVRHAVLLRPLCFQAASSSTNVGLLGKPVTASVTAPWAATPVPYCDLALGLSSCCSATASAVSPSAVSAATTRPAAAAAAAALYRSNGLLLAVLLLRAGGEAAGWGLEQLSWESAQSKPFNTAVALAFRTHACSFTAPGSRLLVAGFDSVTGSSSGSAGFKATKQRLADPAVFRLAIAELEAGLAKTLPALGFRITLSALLCLACTVAAGSGEQCSLADGMTACRVLSGLWLVLVRSAGSGLGVC